MKSFIPFFLILFGFWSCSTTNKYERDLGSISTFSEMVNSGVKRLALSSPLTPDEMDILEPLATKEAMKYNVEVFREPDLLVTDLFPSDITKGKDVLLLFQGNTLNSYLQLKKDKERLIERNEYFGESRIEIARRFGRLLSYTPRRINELLAQNTSFRVLDDFGIKAGNTFLYYEDLGAATRFYTDILGLELLAAYDNASILRMATSSYLILVDAAKGMHSVEEPKSVALALLTDQLPEWYTHLQENNVPIKYEYKPRERGPHDGFVAIDPEGYLLEFEQFKQHQENELFVPILNKNERIRTSIDDLSFYGTITWLYHKDLLKMELFYQNTMGLERVADQGWTKIYRVTDTHFIGLVDEKRGMNQFSEDKAVTVSFIMEDLDGWFAYVQANASFELRSDSVGTGPEGKYRAFVGYGPEGYYLEFDRFYDHPSNTRLLEYLAQ